MARQVAKQAAFLTMALGGPDRSPGVICARSRRAGLTDKHVDRVIGHLAKTLRELAVEEEDNAAKGERTP